MFGSKRIAGLESQIENIQADMTQIRTLAASDHASNTENLILAFDKAIQRFEERSVAKKKPSEEEQYRAAYALNACMVSVSQIVDYQDVNVLQQEYDALLNNLNLENFPKDEALLDALKKILDVCHFYILHAKDKDMLKKKQARRLKDALGKSLSGGSVIAIFGTANPYALIAGAVAMIGVAAVRYKSERDKAKLENELEEWQLEKSALEQLHNLRRTLFETAWRLSDSYGYKDELRLTERQIKMYNEALAESDPLNRYWSLWMMRGSFKAYPLFWYYLGRAAMETADAYRPDQRAGECAERFRYGRGNKNLYVQYMEFARDALEGSDDEEKKCVGFLKAHGEKSLLREDVLAAAAYLDCASLHEDDLCEMFKRVEKAHELSGLDLEINQSCAFRCLHILYNASDAIKKLKAADPRDEKRIDDFVNVAKRSFSIAEETLRMLVYQDFNVELNGRALSKLYIDMWKITPHATYKKDLWTKYEVLRESISKTHAFPYQWILPWDDASFRREWNLYLNGDGLRKTVFNYFYGRYKCIYQEFYEAIAKADKLKDLKPLRDLKKKNWSDGYDKNLSMIEALSDNDPVKVLHGCFWFELPKGSDGTKNAKKFDVNEDKIHSILAKSSKDALDEELKLICKIKDFIDATSERRLITCGLYRHDTDYSEEVFKKDVENLDDILVKFIVALTKLFVKEILSEYGQMAKSDWEKNENPEAIQLITYLETVAENYRKQCIPQEGKSSFVYPIDSALRCGLLNGSADHTTEAIPLATYIPDYAAYDDFDWDVYDPDEFPRT